MLNSFLQQAVVGVDGARQRLCVVNHLVDDSFTPQPSTTPVEIIDFPFIGYAERQLREVISPQTRLTDAAFVILDAQTRKDGCTCRLVSRKEAHFFSVRSEFRGAQRSLDAILYNSTNIQRLCNEAAACGGVLRDDRIQSNHVANSQIVVSFLNKPTTTKTWETCCKPSFGHQLHALIPAFCIAELPLKVGLKTHVARVTTANSSASGQTLNDFIESASNPPGWDKEALQYAQIRVIDSPDISRASTPIQSLYKEPPAFPFEGYTPQMINNIVRSELPGTALNCVLFIILDSFSIHDGSCIIAQNLLREDPFLMLVRVPFETALSSTVSTTCTGLSFEVMTIEAMMKNGVCKD